MEIKQELVHWYLQNQRSLPFRDSRDPYHIWISEIMAQQTQIDTMIPYYLRWIEKFPTIDSVALAQEGEILKAWEGLGYYRRARFIHAAAKKIVSEYNSVFPQDYDSIRSLPGVGDYTAGAIISIAFNKPVLAIDGNVIRVATRLFGINTDPSKRSTIDSIKGKLTPFLDNDNNYILTQAWMEFGALVCTPKNPKCIECPLSKYCFAKTNNMQSSLPISTKKNQVKDEFYDVFINTSNDSILMSLDDSDGLMSGMYRLPQMTQQVRDMPPDYKTKHVFSHKVWKLNIYHNQIDLNQDDWITLKIDELKNVPIITAHKKIINKLLK
ncbi:MAG: A/G-specific adenine glycosylase [Erysipelothrix sp.]|jgi:A/G-specific adenine glycosylase|nr:A/G-specific adenine glycosylase [Erysipelothrix sp.]